MKNGLQSSTATDAGIDYSQQTFTKTFEREGAGNFFANFTREYLPGVKKLKATNRWYVTMIDPKLGLCNFYLVKNGKTWVVDKTGLPKGAQIPEQQIVNWCSTELSAHLL